MSEFKKRCSKCGEDKCGLDFSLKKRDDPSRGLQAWCKLCLASHKRSLNLLRVMRDHKLDEEWEIEQREQVRQDRLKLGLPA